MKKKFMNRKVLIIISSIVVVLISVVIGITYAWYQIQSAKTELDVQSVSNIDVSYTGDFDIYSSTGIPIRDEDIEIYASCSDFGVIVNTIPPKGTKYSTSISINNIIIADELKNAYFKWRLYHENEIVNSDDFSGIGSNTSLYLYKEDFLRTKTSNYRLCIWISESDSDQSLMMNKNFVGKIDLTTAILPKE